MAVGRKPANLEMQGGKGNRQRIWPALRKNREGISLYSLARASGVEDDTVLSYLRCLIAGGYVARNGRTYAAANYSLLRDIGAEAPKLNRDGTLNTQGRGVEAMWRILREVDARDLVQSTLACGEAVSLNTARSYLQWLHKAEYLVLVVAGKPGTPATMARYRLARGADTGPRPPMIQRIGQVFDPNLAEVVYRQQLGADQ